MMSEQAAVGNVTAQTAQQSGVLAKLLVFSVSLAVAPIAIFFLSKNHLWNGDTTLSAITAIFAANVVLVAYVIVSVREERQAILVSPPSQASEESKKDR